MSGRLLSAQNGLLQPHKFITVRSFDVSTDALHREFEAEMINVGGFLDEVSVAAPTVDCISNNLVQVFVASTRVYQAFTHRLHAGRCI